jgi:hypothetical protein
MFTAVNGMAGTRHQRVPVSCPPEFDNLIFLLVIQTADHFGLPKDYRSLTKLQIPFPE